MEVIKNIKELDNKALEISKDVLKTSKILERLDLLIVLTFFPIVLAPMLISIASFSNFNGEIKILDVVVILLSGLLGALLVFAEQTAIRRIQFKLISNLLSREFEAGTIISFNPSCGYNRGNLLSFVNNRGSMEYEIEKENFTFRFNPCKHNRNFYVNAKIDERVFDKYSDKFFKENLNAGMFNDSVILIDSNSELFENGFELKEIHD